MATQPGSDGGRDLVTIFKTGSVDREDYPDLAEHLLEGRTQLAAETGYLMGCVESLDGVGMGR